MDTWCPSCKTWVHAARMVWRHRRRKCKHCIRCERKPYEGAYVRHMMHSIRPVYSYLMDEDYDSLPRPAMHYQAEKPLARNKTPKPTTQELNALRKRASEGEPLFEGDDFEY